MNDKDRPMPPLIAFAGALGGLAVVRWAYRTALRVNRELEEARLTMRNIGSYRLDSPSPRRYGPARLPTPRDDRIGRWTPYPPTCARNARSRASFLLCSGSGPTRAA